MQKIILSGSSGFMGQTVAGLCAASDQQTIAAGIDICPGKNDGFVTYADPTQFDGEADVVIDFSHPSSLTSLLFYCTQRKLPLVLCTTGYSDQQLEEIRRASAQIPIFRSANMSLGINVLLELCRQAALLLGRDWDIEIVEAHHRRKLDAPSGTALMLADGIVEVLEPKPQYTYERESIRRPRERDEIGISSIRGGTITGEHTVLFAGENETLELHHSAQSRAVFAAGALRAAAYMGSVTEPGLYTMQDLVAAVLAK